MAKRIADGAEDGEAMVAELMGEGEVIDFSAVKAPEPIDEGEYFLTIVKAEAKLSKTKNWKVSCRIKIEGGQHDGRQFFEDFSLAPTAISLTKDKLTGIGLDPGFSGTPSEIAAAIEGATFYGKVGIKPADGQYAAKNVLKSTSQERRSSSVDDYT